MDKSIRIKTDQLVCNMIPVAKTQSRAKHARKHRVLQKARELFLLQGYTATTVDDICRAAGVTKGTFFYHFVTKEQMALTLLERFVEEITAPMAFARDPKATSDPLRRIELMLDSFARSYAKSSTPGCLMAVFVSELCPTQPEFARLANRALESLQVAFCRELTAAAFFHQIDIDSLAADLMSRSLVCTLEGSVMLARARGDASVVVETIEFEKQRLRTQFAPQSKRALGKPNIEVKKHE